MALSYPKSFSRSFSQGHTVPDKSIDCNTETPWVTCSSTLVVNRTSSVWTFVFILIDILVQLSSIVYLIRRKLLTKGSFFVLLFILCTSVLFRLVVHTTVLFLATILINPQTMLSTQMQICLYVDYWSNLFSMTLTFVLSLNRCVQFVSKKWSRSLFTGVGLFLTTSFSAFVPLLGAVGIIETSRVSRTYYDGFGFFDSGPDDGWKVLINRSFTAFLVGSIISYLVLFHHLRTQSKLVLRKSKIVKKGEQRAFVLLLVTTFLYIVLYAVYEMVVLIDWQPERDQILRIFLEVLAVANMLPEISLPFLFVVDNFNLIGKIKRLLGPVTETRSVST